jgi:hypothetical protein
MKTKKYKCDVCGKYYEKPMVVTECANCYIKGWKKEFKKKLKEQKEKMNKKQEEFDLSEKIRIKDHNEKHNFIETEDVKEFIRRLKELDENGEIDDDYMIINKERLNKLTGDKLK